MSKLRDININNTLDHAVKSGKWKPPGAKFYDTLIQAFHIEGDVPTNAEEMEQARREGRNYQWRDFIDEAYLVVGEITNHGPYGITPFSRSGCKYPHHVIRGDEMVVSIPGLKAAYARAKQQGIFNGKVKEHLERHYKELGIYEGSTMQSDDIITENFEFIEGVISKSLGVSFNESTDVNLDGVEGITESIEELSEWIDKFVHDEKFREAAVFQSGDFDKFKVSDEELDKARGDIEEANMDDEDLDWAFNTFVEEAEGDNPPPLDEEQPKEEEPKEEKPDEKKEPEKELSRPKQVDKAESDKNGVRRKKLYIAFIEWCKEYNAKNTFGSIFDKDAFHVSYPFVPHEMRYFYRLANPMLCVLAGDLTFFPVAELRKVNSKNSKLTDQMIFAATPNDLRVFKNLDKKVYRGVEENGAIVLKEVLGDTFDTYIQNMIKKGDILNAPLEDDQSEKEGE